MGKYRKLPVEIEAVRFLEIINGDDAVLDGPTPDWLQEAFDCEDHDAPGAISIGTGGSISCKGPYLVIATLEGEMQANPGDWIIRGVKGELYPCKPDIFAETYAPV